MSGAEVQTEGANGLVVFGGLFFFEGWGERTWERLGCADVEGGGDAAVS